MTKPAQGPAVSPPFLPQQQTEIVRLYVPKAAPTPRLKLWLKAAGISKVSRNTLIQRGTLQSWIRESGAYTRKPSVENARLIILMSHELPLGIGPLTYEDIWGAVIPQREVRNVNRKQ